MGAGVTPQAMVVPTSDKRGKTRPPERCVGRKDEQNHTAFQRLNPRQRFNAVALAVQLGTAALERLLDDDAKAGHGGAGLLDDRDQRLGRLAVGQEVVDHQHAVAAVEVTRRDSHGVLGLLGEGVHRGGQQVLGQGQRLVLAGEDHRHAELQAGHHRRGDAAGFDGDDLGHARVGEQAGELVTDQLHQRRVDLVVEKRVDFENLIGKHDAFFANLLMQCFHFVFLDVAKVAANSGKVKE